MGLGRGRALKNPPGHHDKTTQCPMPARWAGVAARSTGQRGTPVTSAFAPPPASQTSAFLWTWGSRGSRRRKQGTQDIDSSPPWGSEQGKGAPQASRGTGGSCELATSLKV